MICPLVSCTIVPTGYRAIRLKNASATAAFDLGVPGVTSISADTHKYGYALKGSSVLLFRPKSLRREQYLSVDGRPGGAYASPGMGGSRSGGLISATWASMLSFGGGYRAEAPPQPPPQP